MFRTLCIATDSGAAVAEAIGRRLRRLDQSCRVLSWPVGRGSSRRQRRDLVEACRDAGADLLLCVHGARPLPAAVVAAVRDQGLLTAVWSLAGAPPMHEAFDAALVHPDHGDIDAALADLLIGLGQRDLAGAAA